MCSPLISWKWVNTCMVCSYSFSGQVLYPYTRWLWLCYVQPFLNSEYVRTMFSTFQFAWKWVQTQFLPSSYSFSWKSSPYKAKMSTAFSKNEDACWVHSQKLKQTCFLQCCTHFCLIRPVHSYHENKYALAWCACTHFPGRYSILM